MKKYNLPYYQYNENGRKVLLTEDNEIKDYIYEETVFNSLIDESLIYHYVIGTKEYIAQSFGRIIEEVYNYPESFKISKKDLDDYSKIEIRYLKKLKYYLLTIGLKDITDNDTLEKRAQYEKLEEYKKYTFINKDNALDIINGSVKELISNEYSKNIKEYSYMFLFDKENNYYGTIRTKNEVIDDKLVGKIEILTKFDNKNNLLTN